MEGDEAEAGQAKTINVHVWHHFPDGVPVTVTLDEELDLNVVLAGTVEVTTPPVPARIRLVPGTPRKNT